MQGRDSPKPGGSRDQGRREVGATSAVGGFHLQQTASFLNGLPPDFYGLEDWNEDAMLSQVRRKRKLLLILFLHFQCFAVWDPHFKL